MSLQYVIGPPLYWKLPFWYSSNYPKIVSLCVRLNADQMRLEDIRICDAFTSQSNVDFSVPAMHRQYLEILYQESVSLSIRANPSHLDAKISHCKVMISATQEQVDKLNVYAKLEAAKNREIEDVTWNIRNEGKVVIHGRPRLTCQKMEFKEHAKKAMYTFFQEEFKVEEPERMIQHVQYIDLERPIYEVEMIRVQDAVDLRKRIGRIPFDDRKKLPYSVMNCVNQASRVRTSILKVYFNDLILISNP